MVSLTPVGPFSLTAAATFADEFPGTRTESSADTLRYAWAVDGDWRTVTATVRQSDVTVHATFDGRPADRLAERAARDLRQILSLDVDGTGFAALGRRDHVVGALQRRFPGLRPGATASGHRTVLRRAHPHPRRRQPRRDARARHPTR